MQNKVQRYIGAWVVYNGRILRVAWTTWATWLLKRQKTRSALAWWRGTLVQQALDHWVSYVEQSRSKRASMTKV